MRVRDAEVRTYWGRSQAEASAHFQADVIELAANGYRPTAQVWIEPSSRVRIVLMPSILVIAAQLIFGLYGAALAAMFGASTSCGSGPIPRGG
jgi:hypothetical protein